MTRKACDIALGEEFGYFDHRGKFRHCFRVINPMGEDHDSLEIACINIDQPYAFWFVKSDTVVSGDFKL